jgi:L-lactate dehydrogenase (cytochrome)
MRKLSIADYERSAIKRLPRCVAGYVCGGTEDERSLRENRRSFDAYGFVPRGLKDVSARHTRTMLWGTEYAMPLGVAPTGLAGLVAHDCDLLLADAAHRAKVPFVISGSSNVPLEEIQKASPGCWYQAYFPGDRERMARMVARLRHAGIHTLVVTMDTAVAANRENIKRLDFTVPFRLTPRLLLDGAMHPRWGAQVFLKTLMARGVPRFANFYEEVGPPITQEPEHGFRTGRDRLTWDDIGWLRDAWRGRLIVKGVLHPDDARNAHDRGIDAVIVSNHGGRQLDGTIAPLQALPAVVAALPSGFPVFVDGGFRRGTDVIKALALGAAMVFIGRPVLYGAAVSGGAGIRHVLEIFREEIDRNLALLGCTAIAELNAALLRRCDASSRHAMNGSHA